MSALEGEDERRVGGLRAWRPSNGEPQGQPAALFCAYLSPSAASGRNQIHGTQIHADECR